MRSGSPSACASASIFVGVEDHGRDAWPLDLTQSFAIDVSCDNNCPFFAQPDGDGATDTLRRGYHEHLLSDETADIGRMTGLLLDFHGCCTLD